MVAKPGTSVISTATSDRPDASAMGRPSGPSTAGTPGWVVIRPRPLARPTRAAKFRPAVGRVEGQPRQRRGAERAGQAAGIDHADHAQQPGHVEEDAEIGAGLERPDIEHAGPRQQADDRRRQRHPARRDAMQPVGRPEHQGDH